MNSCKIFAAIDQFSDSAVSLQLMADDGLLLNFEVGDMPGTNFVSTQYKGRWKERALSKKCSKRTIS
jgi:hypothetical protein